MDVQYYYAAYNHCEAAAGYYAEKYDRQAPVREERGAPECEDEG